VVNEWESYLDKWEKCLPKSGGTMTGPLGLGDGRGKVSADSDEAFLESTEDSNNYRRIELANPSSPIPLSESVKLNTLENGVENNYTLYGTHNLSNATRIKYGTYTGNDGKIKTLDADFDIKLALVYREDMGTLFGYHYSSTGGGKGFASYTLLAAKNATKVANFGETFNLSWGRNTFTFESIDALHNLLNLSNTTYHYVLLG
jgi:hypothetical protein